jgi:hypothetical protein
LLSSDSADNDGFVTSDARRFIKRVDGGAADIHDSINAGANGGFSCVREAHARAFALAHASVIVLAGLQREKEAGIQQHQRTRPQVLTREVECVDAALTEEWRRHIRSAQLEAGAAHGGAAAGWCDAARAMRWFALPFDGLKLRRGGDEEHIEKAWESCVWAKILQSRQHDSSAFTLSEGEWSNSFWAVAWSQQQQAADEHAALVQKQLQLKRDCVTKQQCADVIHPLGSSSTASIPLPNLSSPYIQFLTQNIQRLVPLHPRATFFELCRITGALWNSSASSSSALLSSNHSTAPPPVSPDHPLCSTAIENAINAPESSVDGVVAAALLQPSHPRDWLIKPAISRSSPAVSSSAAICSEDDPKTSVLSANTLQSQAPFSRHPNPPASQKATQLLGSKIRKLMTKASTEFDMIKEGDRVLVGLSGGKDSLTMLVLLLDLQRRAPFKFSIAACTVEPGAAEFDPSPLKAYVTPQLGIPYFFESDTIIQRAKGVGGKFSICAYCARQKRGILYSTALREGYNVLALAQHADDLAESFLMSAMHNGRLRTMKVPPLLLPRRHACVDVLLISMPSQANYTSDRGVRVIRPLM